MKKLLFLTITSFFYVLSITAQPRAIGLRLGANSAELTFHQLLNSEENLLEFDFGTSWHGALQGAITYNWTSSTASGDWTTYAGFGIGGSYSWSDNSWYPGLTLSSTNPTTKVNWYLKQYWTWGVSGMVAVEYKIPNLPIAVSLDYRPLIGFDFGTKENAGNKNGNFGIMYHVPGLWNFGVAARFLLR
ncbi:MAG: hypothetical protein FWD66_11080 [Paludibacter sp.]|nr:hypothetical protein [Paludibacter sp.]